MKQVYIVDAVRTPIGSFGGTLSPVRTDDLAAIPIRELMKRNPNLDPSAIEDLIFGCANQAGEDNRNVARMALLLAGLPWSVGGETVNRLCSSGMASTINAARAIQTGNGDLYISGGVEHMTRGPWVISKASQPFGRDAEMHDTSFGWRFINPKMEELYGTEGMGQTAENLVELYGIEREAQDLFAYNSHMKAAAARESGRLAEEIVAVEIPQRKADSIIFNQDEFIKPNTSLEVLGKLRAAFKKDGSVTAGNSSGLNDGAAAILVSSEQGLKDHNLKPMARIVSAAVAGVEPRIMGIGPIEAIPKACAKAGIKQSQIERFELNEAFAAQSLAVIRTLKLDPAIINPTGGAIALGHPLGATGGKLTATLLHGMKRDKQKYGMVTMCIGTGMGAAALYEIL